MINWEQFHFLRPGWLAALAPLGMLLLLVATRRLGSRNWEAVCDAALLPHILIGAGAKRDWRLLFFAGICGVTALIALAGPVWEKLPQPVYSSKSALVIALDLSRSMDADDVNPSRMARARFKINDLLRTRQDGQTALLVYAGDAFTVTPLTDDVVTIASQLPALATEIMPVPGNRTDRALRLAGELLRQAGLRRGDILLITDEVDPGQATEEGASLFADGYRVYVLGVGTEQGAPVRLPDGSFLKDKQGQIVIPALQEKPMQELAERGGGTYVRLGMDDADVEHLAAAFNDRPLQVGTLATGFKTDAWREQGPWLVLLLLPFAALAFRRGYVMVLVTLILPFPEPAQAFDWDGLWRRPDQQGMQAIEQGDAHGAAKLFERPDWKGAAQYRAGDFTGAEGTLSPLEDAESIYNRGNALARLGRYADAVAAYDEVLSVDPGHADARINKEIVEEQLKQQQQQAQQEPQPGSGADQDPGQRGGQGESNPDTPQSNETQPGESELGQGGNDAARADQPDAGAQPSDAAVGDDTEDQAAAESREEKAGSSGGKNSSSPAYATAPDHAPDETPGQGNEHWASSDRPVPDEQTQATEQWLRRIPDDPAGLLRRKFLYQYQQRDRQPAQDEKTW